MNLRQLEIFVAVVEEGSLTRASERVHIVQPALTQHIKSLELDIGIPLLVRNNRGVRPTEAGLRLFERASALLAQFRDLRQIVRGAGYEPAGEVRVGISTTLSTFMSARLVTHVAETYPGIRVHIVEPMVGVVSDWLQKGQVDFALMYRPKTAKSLELSEILSERLDLCGSPESMRGLPSDGPPGLGDVAQLPLIIQHKGYGVRDQLDDLAKQHGLSLKVSVEIDAVASIKALAQQGLGFCLLPPMATVEERAQGKLVSRPIVKPELRRSIYLARFSGTELSSAAAAVFRACGQLITTMVNEGTWEAQLET
jgi:LysR family nitrogen assimilation transcriptional regulator